MHDNVVSVDIDSLVPDDELLEWLSFIVEISDYLHVDVGNGELVPPHGHECEFLRVI